MTRSSQQIFDEWLITCGQTGDRQALERLLKRWQPKLFSYACSQVRDQDGAADVVQEALIVISKDLHRLKDPAAFPKWAFQILHRRACDWIKIQQRQRRNSQSLIQDPEDLVSDDKHELSLFDNLHLLEVGQYQVVRLFYLEGFSVGEIAEIVNVSAGTVKSRLFSARQKLKDLYE